LELFDFLITDNTKDNELPKAHAPPSSKKNKTFTPNVIGKVQKNALILSPCNGCDGSMSKQYDAEVRG
jgi:hypothetical protein